MRRRYLLTTAGIALLGKLHGANRPPVDPDPAVRIDYWTNGPGGIEPEALDDLPVRIDGHQHATRVDCKSAVVEGIHAGTPPDSFQVILGDGIDRYPEAHTIHALPDVIDENRLKDVHPGVRPLIVHDGNPVAVPIAWSNVNRLEVRPTLTLPSEFDAFCEAVQNGELAVEVDVATDPVVDLWMLELCLLAVAGTDGHAATAAGDVTVDDLQTACTAADILLARRDDYDDEPACRVVPPFSAAPNTDWEPRPLPGTKSFGLVAAIGCTLAKRGPNPATAVKFLETVADPTIQETLIDATPRRPAIDPARLWSPGSGSSPRAVERWRPSMAVGCGLDMDVRRRVLEVLTDTPFGASNGGPNTSDLHGALT